MSLLEEIRPTWLEVNLNNLIYNIRNIRKFVQREVKIMAVVKADAYGHGAVICGKIFLENGADMLAVATITEAIELRKGNIKAPILVLGYTQDNLLCKGIEYDITQTIYTLEQAKIVSEYAKEMNVMGKIHVKVDTGMSRLGFTINENSIKEIEAIIRLDNIDLEGIFSHLLQSDTLDKSISKEQFRRFKWILSELEDRDIDIPIKHISNSASALDMPEYNLDMVRIGIMLYGMYSSDEVQASKIDLKLASSFKTRVAQFRNIKKGDYVGYDQGFIADKDMKIATIPVGYADGYTKEMFDITHPSIEDIKIPVIGKICMDQSMIDVSKITHIERNDIVSLYRNQGDDMIPELICTIGRRVPRVYVFNEEIVLKVDYILDK